MSRGRTSTAAGSAGPAARLAVAFAVALPVALAVAFAVALAACGGDTGSDAPSPREAPPPAEGPADGGDAGPPDTAPSTSPDTAPPDTARAVPPDLSGQREWTAGIVRIPPVEGRGMAILRSVRAARHEGSDRAVWEFTGGRPGVHVEYVDEPVRACGSGHPVELAGDGWLEVRFEPAAAHVDGERTFDRNRLAPRLPVVLEVVSTCDFEGVVTWVVGVASPEPYRVTLLDDPSRVVVDVRHRDR